MCIAKSIKEGKTPRSYTKQAAKISDRMNEEQLKEYCETRIEPSK